MEIIIVMWLVISLVIYLIQASSEIVAGQWRGLIKTSIIMSLNLAVLMIIIVLAYSWRMYNV
jgi:hypothetical protein